MMRAGAAARRLDPYVASLRARGMMREFTRRYKLRRAAATARGEGFMLCGNAEARPRQALIPLLVGERDVGATHSLFAESFDR